MDPEKGHLEGEFQPALAPDTLLEDSASPEQSRPPLDLEITEKRLYHGSPVGDISEMSVAENDTIGQGVYFTSDSERASEYAIRRSGNRGGDPTVYEAEIKDLKLANLTDAQNIAEVLQGFRPVLAARLEEGGLVWYAENALREAITTIDAGEVGLGLRRAVESCQRMFTDYLKAQGYDGLVGVEGGEPGVERHDSYVIFDPQKAKLVAEHPLNPRN